MEIKIYQLKQRCAFVSVQELNEASNSAGGQSESPDRTDESGSEGQSTNEEAAVKMEPVEAKQEVAAPPPARRASTSTPSNLPVRLLTRLGSLDGEFMGEKAATLLHLTVKT